MLQAEGDPVHVHGQGALEQRSGQVGEADPQRLDAGIVHQHVDPAKFFPREVEHRRHVRLPGHIRGAIVEAVGRRMPVRDQHAGARRGEAPGDGPADPGGASGDDREFSRE